MSGSMYDISVTTISPEGKIYQIEYAQKAVENAETIVGIKCKDGVILGAEKQVFNKLLVEGTNKRIYNVDQSIGMVIGGKIPDGRNIMNRARQEAGEYQKQYALPISGTILADRVGLYVHHFTLQGWQRPFGSQVIISSYNKYDGYKLHMVDPSGLCYAYNACAQGKGRQVAKAEFEKRDFKNMTCRQALVYLAKILNLTHEEYKDKPFEFELSWLCSETNNVHQYVTKELQQQVEKEALKLIEDDDMAE